MSDTDSLYRLSISPPSRYPFQSEHMGHNPQSQAYPVTPVGQSSKRPRGNGDLRNYVQTTTYPAPMAKMRATPVRDDQSVFQMPTPSHSDKGKRRAMEPSPPVLRSNISKSKETIDLQAQADAVENARDRADPDFKGTQDSDDVLLPRKRRRESRKPQSPRVVKTKQKRQHNRLYVKCTEETRNVRDRHIARMRENWGVAPDQWMPLSIMPSTPNKSNSRRATRQPLLDPRDWNGSLLAELAYLSSLTKGRPEEAYEALQNTVSDKTRGGGGPELLPGDVQRVIPRFGTTTGSTDRVTAPPEHPAEETHNDPGRFVTTVSTAIEQEQVAAQIPSQRSPTLANEVAVKQESRSEPPIPMFNSGIAGWRGLDAELDKSEELDLQTREAQARLALASAERASFEQRKRLREAMRLHGSNRQDAILITAEDEDQI